jgi:hypothetical protein
MALERQFPDGFGRSAVARCWAGFASLGAGLVHFAVVHEHFQEWWLFGVFFLIVGVLQIGWAMLALARDTVPIPRLTAAASVAILVLWVVSRTSGIPVGPEPWAAEPWGTADILCAVLEAVVVVLLLVILRSRTPATTNRKLTRTQLVLLAVGALVMAAITTPALAATQAGEEAHPMGGMSGMHMTP